MVVAISSRTARTRAQLQAVALRLFSEQGYDATTVEQVLAAWRDDDLSRAIHPADREAVRATEADRVVPELGDPPHVNVTLADLGELAAAHAPA